MTLQKPRPGEELSTELALAGLIVRPQVHGVRRHRHVDLAACGALSCLLVTERSVGLSVPGKIAGGAVSLAALLAVVAVRFWPSLELHGCQIVVKISDFILKLQQNIL